MGSYYDQPRVLTYNYTGLNIGAGTITRKIRVPRGAQSARVFEAHVYATTTFNAVTTEAKAQVGVTGDLGKFAELGIGTLAAGSARGFADAKGFKAVWNKGTDDVAELTVTFVAPTGGTPAGVADVAIAIGWDFIGE